MCTRDQAPTPFPRPGTPPAPGGICAPPMQPSWMGRARIHSNDSFESLPSSVESFAAGTATAQGFVPGPDRSQAANVTSRFGKWLRGGGSASSTATGSGPARSTKRALKSRVCSMYEKVFDGKAHAEHDSTAGGLASTLVNWDEFWLLKVDTKHIRHCFSLVTTSHLLQPHVSKSIRFFLARAKAVACNDFEDKLRRTRAFETLAAFLWGVFSMEGWGDFTSQALEVVCGVVESQLFFGDLIKAAERVLCAEQQGAGDGDSMASSCLTASYVDPLDNTVSSVGGNPPAAALAGAVANNTARAGTTAHVGVAALRFILAVACGRRDCGANPLVEIPATYLTPPAGGSRRPTTDATAAKPYVFDDVFACHLTRVEGNGGWSVAACLHTSPSPACLDALTLLAVLHSYSQTQLAAGAYRAYLAEGMPEEAFRGLLAVVLWVLHTFNRAHCTTHLAAAAATSWLSMAGIGWMVGASSSTPAAGTVGADPSGWRYPHGFDPAAPNTAIVPRSVLAALLLFCEAAGAGARVAAILALPADYTAQLGHLPTKVTAAASASHPAPPGATTSAVLTEFAFASSTILQMNKHPFVHAASTAVLLAWARLLRDPRILSHAFTPNPSARYVIADKTPTAWDAVLHEGARLRDEPADAGGAPAGVVYRLLDEFVSRHLRTDFDALQYAYALDALVCMMFYQREAKIKVDWRWEHVTEKVFEVVKLVARLGAATQAGAKLLKQITGLMRLFLARPTVLYTEEDQLHFIHELVRSRSALDVLLAHLRIVTNVAAGTPPPPAAVRDALGFFEHVLALVEEVEAALTPTEPSAHDVIGNVLDLRETRPEGDVFARLPSDASNDMSAKRDPDLHGMSLAALRDVLAATADPAYRGASQAQAS